MGTTISQSNDDLVRHLSDHLSFLHSSALAYDNGFESEAKRLAVSLRVLLHDTSMSKSLLGQLGRKNILFLDTCYPFNKRNLVTFSGLVMICTNNTGAHYVPHLDNPPPAIVPKKIEFEDWWNATIIVDNQQNTLSRKTLVLAVANKDGGAHVDPNLDEVYARLSRDNSMGMNFINQSGNQPISGVELASIRQITYEVIKTIDSPLKTKRKRHKKGK